MMVSNSPAISQPGNQSVRFPLERHQPTRSATLKYLEEAGPKLVGVRDEGVLFLGDAGEGLHVDYLTQRVRQYIEAAGLEKPGACHRFRHSMATAMLEGGADVRFVQEMLGHASLETTQLYTRVTIEKLKAVHAATHPAARLTRGVVDDDAEVDELLERC